MSDQFEVLFLFQYWVFIRINARIIFIIRDKVGSDNVPCSSAHSKLFFGGVGNMYYKKELFGGLLPRWNAVLFLYIYRSVWMEIGRNRADPEESFAFVYVEYNYFETLYTFMV